MESPFACKPLGDIYFKEEKENIQDLVRKYFDPQVNILRSGPALLLQKSNGQTVNFIVDPQVTACDNKAAKMLSGRTGAPCIGCDASREDFLNPKLVSKGSYLNMTCLKTNAKYLNLAQSLDYSEEDIQTGVPIPSKDRDFAWRQGVKEKPMTSSFDFSTIPSVLHESKLCPFRFLREKIARLSSGCLQWGKGQIKETVKKRLDSKYNEFDKILGDVCGYKGNLPNRVNGKITTFSRSYLSTTITNDLEEKSLKSKCLTCNKKTHVILHELKT